jgi:uncharacterized protein YciI
VPLPKDVPRNLKPYHLGLLSKGEHWNDLDGSEDLAPRQLAFIRQQTEAGRYKLAGPVVDGGEIVGMMIIEAENADEALAIAQQDPAVQAGRLSVRVHAAFLPSLDAVHVDYSSNALQAGTTRR